jgi:hypothetical protein
MRIYEDYSSGARTGQPMDVDSTLRLDDNGEFEYGEYWHDPVASCGLTVTGSWYQAGDGIVLSVESSTNPYSWKEGSARKAVVQGSTVKIENGGTLSLRPAGDDPGIG